MTTSTPLHAASPKHRAERRAHPPATDRRRRRVLTGILAAVTATGVTAVAVPSASAAISAAGPVDPASLFPSYYADANGLKLQMCQDGPSLCLAGPEQIQDVHAAGGDAEAFYFHASAEIGAFTIETALEAAYADVGAGQENTFQRRQGIAQAMTPNGKYTFTDPYGTYTCTADGSGRVQPSKGCRFETTPIPGNFTAALGGPIGPFLTWDTFGQTGAGAPPAGYIGDGATPHKVVGSPTGFNKMRVSGPGITGTCTNTDGSTVTNCQETDKIIVQGKVQPGGAVGSLSAGTLDYGDIPATPAVTKTLTYSNVGDAPIALGAPSVTGTGAAAFGVTNKCPATVGVGTQCTIDVTFTPQAGKASSATLTITDDTPVGSRTVALKGSNLPKMFVSDPAPAGTALTFGNVPLNTDSAENNVVIGNSGNGPLTVTSATVTGASAAQFPQAKVVNRCATAVEPDGGCEIGVVFHPTSTGGKTANLRVTDAAGAIVNVPLTGTGATAAPDATLPTMSTLSGSLSGTTANLSWGVATDNVGVTGYRVLRGGTQIGTTDAATRTFSDPGRAAGVSNSYTVRAVDAAGNVSAPSNTVTLTVPSANTPPRLTAQSPATNGTGVLQTANVTATFNEGVSGVSGSTFTLKNAAGAAVSAVVSYNATTRVATLNPNANLAADTKYTATLTTGIRDAGSASFAGTSWTFLTGPRPTVSNRVPVAGATAASRTANLTATFSEGVLGATGTNVKLTNATTGAAITSTVTYNATTRVVTINPSATLAANTSFRVTLTSSATGIRDAAGNTLGGTTTWTFKTGA